MRKLIPATGDLSELPPPLRAKGRPLSRDLDAVREDSL
jgi:hypothetical protein